jgi:hypothetical protein
MLRMLGYAVKNQLFDCRVNRHKPNTIMCFVQFLGVAISDLPRVYLARPSDVATWLKTAAGGRGDTVLREHHLWGKTAQAAGTVDQIPSAWHFNCNRAHELATSEA